MAAEFDNPVMLYSIGKDSTVMAHLTFKAFSPGKVPFPFLHVDTTFKFQEMYEFRSNFAKQKEVDLIVHKNQEGIANNINPFDHGSSKYTDIMKTQGLKQALNLGQYDAAFGASVRKIKSQERIYLQDSFHQWIQRINDRMRSLTMERSIKLKVSASSHYPTGLNWTFVSFHLKMFLWSFDLPRDLLLNGMVLGLDDDERLPMTIRS